MRSKFDGRGDSSLSGSALRNEAATYVEAIYGPVQIEQLVDDKKVDIVCRTIELGKPVELLVEAKDYGKTLERKDVVNISTDYSPLLETPSRRLLLVTRHGLSPSAQAFVQQSRNMFHQTIWELEDSALGLVPYVRDQVGAFDEEGLSSYYVDARARVAQYDADQQRSLGEEKVSLLELVEAWIDEPGAPPLAILGGYGAGKSSFARRVLSRQAKRALENPAARRPVIIRLGGITRASGLDSLLGSLFTSQYEVRGYSFRRFKELNQKGRLLIILDGFDEMKHAMSWTEFLNEIKELNSLNTGASKVLLLGRPTAFTSDDEHLHVLRGRRREEGGSTRRLLDWPEFREYELEPFTPEERADFVRRFLSYAAATADDASGLDVAARAEEVNRLADQDPEVFGKPVHAKILVELALDPKFDLSTFAEGVTRWTLYKAFFDMLARRETEKPARSPIEAPDRHEFLSRLAVWLWKERDGATAFKASEIPTAVLDKLPSGDAETLADKRREYLAGAFLERKAAETYYFPHRSFAEFLVAEHLSSQPPQSRHHEEYSTLYRDGVGEFLEVAPPSRGVSSWITTLDANSGRIPIDYLLFLVDRAGGFNSAVEKLPDATCWKPLLTILGSDRSALHARQAALGDAILNGSQETVALTLAALTRFHDLVPYRAGFDRGSPIVELSEVAAAALIARIVRKLREPTPQRVVTIGQSEASMLDLARAAVTVHRGQESTYVTFSWERLGRVAAEIADETGPTLALGSGDYEAHGIADMRIPYGNIRRLMPEKHSTFFHGMILMKGGLDQVTLVGHSERRRRVTST